MDFFDSLSIHPYRPSVLVSPLYGIQYLYKADEYKFYWSAITGVSIR